MGPQMILGILIRAKDQASQVMGKVERGMQGLADTSERAASRFQASSKMFKGGAAAMGAGAVVLGGLGATALKASSFNAAMAEVSTLVDTASVDMDQLSNSVLDMSSAYGAAPIDTAKALYQTISAGVSDAADATKLLDIANRTAIGGVTDVATAVDGLTTLMNAYGLSVEQAEILSDQMFIAMKAGKTTIGELSNTIGRVAPTAQALNISTGELLASISALTTQGIKTSESVSGMKAALANVMKPTTEATKAWDRMTKGTELAGVAFNATTLQTVGLPKFLDMVTQATGGSAEKMAELFGSVEALNTMLALTGGGAEAFAKTLADMGTPAGTTQEAYGKMASEFDQTMKRMKESLNVMIISIGQVLIPIFQPVIEKIGAIARAVADWARRNPKLAKTLAKVAAVIGTVLFVGGGIVTLLGMIGMASAATTMGLAALGKMGFGGLIPSIGKAITMLWKFAAALMTNPIGIAVMAVVGLVMILRKLGVSWKDVTNAFKAAWKWITGVFSGLGDFFMGVWNKVKGTIPYLLAIFLPFIGLPLVIAKHWDQIVAFLSEIWERVKEVVLSAVTALWDGIVAVFNFGLETIKNAVMFYVDIIKGIWNGLIDAVVFVWESIKNAVGAAMNFIHATVGAVIRGVTGFFTGLRDTVVGIWDSIIGAFVSAINTVIGFINGIIRKVNKVSRYVGIRLSEISPIAYHTGFEVTKTGLVPPATLERGEVLVDSDTSKALKGMADAFMNAGSATGEGRIANAISNATGAQGAAVGGDEAVPAAAATAGTAFVLQEGAVVISFPAVTSVTEVEAEDLMNRIEEALQTRAKRGSESMFTGDFKPTLG